MAFITNTEDTASETYAGAGFWQIVSLPDWLAAIAQPDRVIEAPSRCVSELVSGAMTIHACKIKHLGLDDDTGCWSGEYTCTVEAPAPRRSVALRGTLIPPSLPAPDAAMQPAPAGFGADGWHCYLPELRLDLQPLPPEPDLSAPAQHRAYAGMPARHLPIGLGSYVQIAKGVCGQQCKSSDNQEFPEKCRCIPKPTRSSASRRRSSARP